MHVTCSPRVRSSTSSSEQYESAKEEESSSSSQEEAWASNPSTSLPARVVSFMDKAPNFKTSSPRLSPDRTSYDGVELEQASTSATSRYASRDSPLKAF